MSIKNASYRLKIKNTKPGGRIVTRERCEFLHVWQSGISLLNMNTKKPGEALSTFIRASGDPKGEQQLSVAIEDKVGLKIPPKVGLLRPKTMAKYFLNKSKTTLKKSRKRFF